MTTFNLDGYQEAVLGTRQLSMGSAVSALNLYSTGGLFARVVDKPADDVIAKGVTIEGDDGSVAGELDRLKVMPAIADGIRWSRLTGGAALVLIADDGGLLPVPLNPGSLAQIDEIKVFDLTDISAEPERYNDATQRNFGMPVYYRIQAGGAQFRVHESRLIEIPGDPLPRQVANATKNIPWAGRNAVDRTYKAIMDYCEGVSLSKSILKRKQQPTYKMKGLADAINAGMEAQVQKRIGLVDTVRGVLNTVAVDSEDDFTVQDMNLSGVKDVIGELKSAVSAESGMPITLIFGESPGGLNSTGQHDSDNYNGMVRAIQQNKATPALERIVSLIFAQSTVTLKSEDWSIVWPALDEPTDKESADIRKTNADAELQEMKALEAATLTGAVSEEQALVYLKSRGMFGLDNQGTQSGAASYANET